MEKTQVEIKIRLELHIQLLGGFSVSINKKTIPEDCWRSRRARNLLKLLTLTPDHRLHRDQVIEALWANSDLAAAANNFHQTLYAARRVLEAAGASVLALEDGILSLAQTDGQALTVDLERFETAAAYAKDAKDPRTYQDALAIYSGDLLPDDLYEEWTISRREALRLTFSQLLLDMARLHKNRQEYPQGIAALQRLLSVDPSHEEGHAGLMRLYALNGQRQQAIRQYQTLCEVLCQELEAEPSQSTSSLFELIQSGGFTPNLPSVQSAHNLPVQVTSFIGREKEIAALKQIILSGWTRLVTVTGAGGTGKTRLALRAAEELLDAFPQGVWLVELAAVTDPDLVPAAVAAALKQRENPDKPILEALVEFLQPMQTLIILDTCEHLVDAVASLADWILRASSQVTILATSREILGVGGEMPFLCPSLALPAPHMLKIRTEIEQLAALVSSEAVRLFVERSALASPGFTITEKNVAIIAQVCRRLDGIPLAIELAAARMRLLSIEQIADRLNDAFVLLTGGSRTALPRQQTLKATIDWSYNLLTPIERSLLLRLSIFSGGWMLEAAEAICSGDGAGSDNISPEEILDLLGHLADKSLIVIELGKDGNPRYRMLDTVHQYAYDRLLEAGGESNVRDRHLAYFLQLAEQAQQHLRARGMVEWLNRLEVELGNLRLALDWSLTGHIEEGLRLGSALFHFWHIRSRRFEGIHWLERLLEVDLHELPFDERAPSSQLIRGVALIVAGNLNHYYPGIYTEHAQTQFKEGKTIIRELGDLGQKYLPFVTFNSPSSEEEYRQGLALARKFGDEFHTAELLWVNRSSLMNSGDTVLAAAYAQENLAIRKKIGDMDGEAHALNILGEHEFMHGDPKRAVELWEASAKLYLEIENVEFGLFVSGDPARAALAQGDYDRALRICDTQLAAGQRISSTLVIVDALGFMARTAWALKGFDQFKQRYAEFLEPDWENNLPCGRGTLLYAFGRARLSQGDFDRARIYLKQFSQMGLSERFLSVQSLGILAAARGQYRRASVIFSALDQRFNWLKNVSCPAEREEYQQALTSARASLGEVAFAAAWAEGQALTLEQLQALALKKTG